MHRLCGLGYLGMSICQFAEHRTRRIHLDATSLGAMRSREPGRRSWKCTTVLPSLGRVSLMNNDSSTRQLLFGVTSIVAESVGEGTGVA